MNLIKDILSFHVFETRPNLPLQIGDDNIQYPQIQTVLQLIELQSLKSHPAVSYTVTSSGWKSSTYETHSCAFHG